MVISLYLIILPAPVYDLCVCVCLCRASDEPGVSEAFDGVRASRRRELFALEALSGGE